MPKSLRWNPSRALALALSPPDSVCLVLSVSARALLIRPGSLGSEGASSTFHATFPCNTHSLPPSLGCARTCDASGLIDPIPSHPIIRSIDRKPRRRHLRCDNTIGTERNGMQLRSQVRVAWMGHFHDDAAGLSFFEISLLFVRLFVFTFVCIHARTHIFMCLYVFRGKLVRFNLNSASTMVYLGESVLLLCISYDFLFYFIFSIIFLLILIL